MELMTKGLEVAETCHSVVVVVVPGVVAVVAAAGAAAGWEGVAWGVGQMKGYRNGKQGVVPVGFLEGEAAHQTPS